MHTQPHTKAAKKKMREASRRMWADPVMRAKTLQARIGKQKGKDNPMWKGKAASYSAFHYWMRSKFGTPQSCEVCGRTEPPKNKGKKTDYFQWASKNGLYTRLRRDWLRLCVKCHWHYDRKNSASFPRFQG